MFTSLLAASLVLVSAPATAQNARPGASLIQRNVVDPFKLPSKIEYSKDHIVVSYNPQVTESLMLSLERQIGLEVMQGVHQSEYFVLLSLTESAKHGGMTVERAVELMLTSPAVRYAEFDPLLEQDYIPNDTRFGEMWGLHNTGQSGGVNDADIDAPEAWDIAGNHPEIVVAVADDGYSFTHPDLANVHWVNEDEIPGNGIDDDGNGFVDDWRGWDFSSNDNNPTPAGSDSHGTHTSGTVGADHNNGIGVTGVGPNIKVMPIRMYGGSVQWMTALANGVDYSWRNGATAISVSYAIDGYTQALVDSIGRAKTAGMAYINSAGNNNQNNPPRQQLRNIHDNVLFVGSSTRTDARSSFSNYGSLIEIFAPGSDILSTLPGNTYGMSSGTSMSTPHVAGAYGVVAAMFPELGYRQVLDRIINTSDQVAALMPFVTDGRRLNLNSALDDDSTPPAAVTGLTMLRRAYTVGEFQLTATGDDGMTGTADKYEVRISSSPITQGNFASAALTDAFIAPEPAGTTVKFQVRGIAPGQNRYLGVVAYDNLGNASPVASFGPFKTQAGLWLDTVEGTSHWTGAGGWAITSSQSFSPTKSWTDSPSGNYGNNANTSMTMNGQVAVTGVVALTFVGKIDLETNDDWLHIEAQKNGGAWESIGRLTGTADWKSYAAVYDSGSGGNVRFRFRLTSDGSTTRDGVYLDDIAVVPYSVVFSDNVEGADRFVGTGTWGKSTTIFNSPSRSWTDSPSGNYGNNVNSTLTSNADIDIRSIAGAQVKFMTRYDLEAGYDYLSIQVNNGASTPYETLSQLNGTNTTWTPFVSSLGDREFLRLRFLMQSDFTQTRDGAYFDDIVVAGEPWQTATTVTGVLNVGQYEGDFADRPFTIQVRQPGTQTVLETFQVVLTRISNGTARFTIETSQSGVKDISFVAHGYLRRTVGNVNIQSGMGDVNATMVMGDLDGDNFISWEDQAIVRRALNTVPGDPKWNPLADLTGNGMVDKDDHRWPYNNLGMYGDN